MEKVFSRKMAERIVCSAIVFCVALLCGGTPSFAQSQSSSGRPSLPEPARLDSASSTLDTLTPEVLARSLSDGAATASDCRFDDDVTCADLVWTVDGLRIAAARWTHSRESLSTWTALVITDERGWELSAASWSHVQSRVEIEALRIEHPGRPALVADIAVLETTDKGTKLLLRGVSWREVRANTPQAVEVMSAPQATFEDGHWSIDGLRLEPAGPQLGDVRDEEPSIRSGFLPPSVVHVGGDVTELDAVAVRESSVLGHGVAGYLRGAPGHWYGVGTGVVGDYEAKPDAPGLRHDSPLATVGVIWAPGARAAVAAEGDAIFGRTLDHAAVALETPGYAEAWRTQSVRRGAFYRDWSLTRAGVALHGGGHALRASALDARAYSGLGEGRVGGGRLGFGVEHSINDRTDLGLEVEHISLGSSGQDQHLSSIRSDIFVGFGRPDKAFARVGALGRLRARLVPTDVGFGAGTSGGLYVAGRAGLSWTGSFDESKHLVRPSVFAISEVVEFEKSAAEAISDGGDTPVGTAVADPNARPWHSTGIRLDQRVTRGAWQYDFPVELFAATFGSPESVLDAIGASGGLVTSYINESGAEFRARGHLVCERACQSVAWDAGAGVRVSNWDAYYDIARSNRLAQRIADLHATHDAWSRIIAFELPPSSLRVSQSAGVGWERRRFRIDVSGVTDMDAWGAAVEPRLAFGEMGWSVGLTGFYNDFDAEWGLQAGLRTY